MDIKQTLFGTQSDQPTPEVGVQLDRLVMPFVLDACCGSRMMWFDKNDSRALFQDCREEVHQIAPNRGWPSGTTIHVAPDVVGDFSDMVWCADGAFAVCVFDPPHLRDTKSGLRANGLMSKRYGLLREGWESVISQGFAECFRVLRPGGVLVFKWGETEIPLSKILKLTKEKPLFGHHSGKKMGTHWVIFLKA